MSNLTQEEKDKMQRMEESVERIEKSSYQVEASIKEIKDAIMGSRLLGDRGFIGRLIAVESRQEKIESELKVIREKEIKTTIYSSLINWIFRLIISAMILTTVGIVVTKIITR